MTTKPMNKTTEELVNEISEHIILTKRDIKRFDIVFFNKQLCYVSEKTSSKTILKFYSEEKSEIRVYSIPTKKEPLNVFDILLCAEEHLNPLLLENLEKEKVVFKKYDYVSFDRDGVKTYGTVLSVGKRLKVVFDNAELELTASPVVFTKEKAPVIEIPEELKNWTFASFKEHKQMSEETVCFSVTVKKNNKKSFIASNRGHGGCMDVDCFHAGKSDISGYNEFCDLVANSVIALYPDSKGSAVLNEIEESYILWFNQDRKLHISWSEYMKSSIELFAS